VKYIRTIIYVLITGIFAQQHAHAQEYSGHLLCNPSLFNIQAPKKQVKKTTATALNPLSLPFFEDFTGYSVFPDSSKWQDYEVFINNTMGFKPVSRGMATFDALDYRGIPYDSFSNTNFRYADSLTSQPINLSVNVVTPGDSVYFSFFYQPQGNGYYPLIQDSLILYFKTRFGGFQKVWSVSGTSLAPFKQVMIPISDSVYYDSSFQFRFVNIGALYWADAIWNVDYIRLNSGRNQYDTAINDIGFSSDPSFLLNDYSSMPYRQFNANPGIERAGQYSVKVTNNYVTAQAVTCGYTGIGLNTGDILRANTWNPAVNVPAMGIQSVVFPRYNTLIPITSVGAYDKVVFENTFFLQSISTSDPTGNDTVVKDIIFDNYLAYDDGSAEKSYYLNLYPTLPGKIAIEYHLNTPDTMRGMSICFGKQVPFATNKFFNIVVYSSLRGVNGSSADHILYTQELCLPGYADTLNHFWNYRFDRPLALPAGTFYAGTFQPAQSGSDSLYIGLDVNRVGSNHAYYDVLSGWTPSLISGAIMMRPLLGRYIQSSSINDVQLKKQRLLLSPNPVEDQLKLEFESTAETGYYITDISGRNVLQGTIYSGKSIDISTLRQGMYFVTIVTEGIPSVTEKLIKR